MVYVSLGLRLRVEVEALNMVEALGAYTRHRTVSMLKKLSRDGRTAYKIILAPAVSGQAVNYGYSRVVTELADKLGLGVCNACRASYTGQSGFEKRANENVDHDTRVKECVVEDLTGFLAPQANVRRTSPVSFSYMVPDLEGAKAAVDAQFHVRYSADPARHAIFNVESGTAIYIVSVAIDVDKIGRLSNGSYVGDRMKRIELAFKALAALFEGLAFGAKKARYLPVLDIVGGISAVSHPIPFMVSPPRVYRDGRNYITDTLERAKYYIATLGDDVNETIKTVYMDREGLQVRVIDGVSVEHASTLSELVSKTLNIVKEMLRE